MRVAKTETGRVQGAGIILHMHEMRFYMNLKCHCL